MRPEFIKFIPVATMLIALIIGIALNPTVTGPVWWAIPAGLIVGLAIQYGARRMNNAR